MSPEEIPNIMGFHPATDETRELHEELRSKFIELAVEVSDILPVSRESSLCFTKLQEALMFANAAVAIHMAPLGRD